MKITAYIFYETNSSTTNFMYAKRKDSIDRALDLGSKGSPPSESLSCVLEQDTLSTA